MLDKRYRWVVEILSFASSLLQDVTPLNYKTIIESEVYF